jgi:hypothetical protein
MRIVTDVLRIPMWFGVTIEGGSDVAHTIGIGQSRLDRSRGNNCINARIATHEHLDFDQHHGSKNLL